MAGQAGSKLRGLVYMSGMVTFLGAMSMVPRISIRRDEDSTTIKYHHLKSEPSGPAPPQNEGIVLSPSIERSTNIRDPRGQKPWSSNDWIFDTGATSHVCSNRSLLHRYSSFNPYTNTNPSANMMRRGNPVAHFGPNPISVAGVGDTFFVLPGRERSSLSKANPFGAPLRKDRPNVEFLTVKHVMHIPEAGINIISWSQLKQSTKGLELSLVEGSDGALVVQSKHGPVMRFVLRDGLYFLDQTDEAVLKLEPDG